jgi:hypothetical protein
LDSYLEIGKGIQHRLSDAGAQESIDPAPPFRHRG